MELNRDKISKWYERNKTLVFFYTMLALWAAIFLFVPAINTLLKNLFSDVNLYVDKIRIDNLGVIVAPVVEESFKMLAYSVIFLADFNKIFNLGYKSKKEFINNNIGIIFLLSVGLFGLQEGISHNLGYSAIYLWAFWILNTLIHITYSVYPFIFGRKYKNYFICFLPIAILLHSVHNFLIIHAWDNKWITFGMVTIFLLPLIFLERKKILMLFRKLKKINQNRIKFYLIVLSIIFYLYIFLSLFLAFR